MVGCVPRARLGDRVELLGEREGVEVAVRCVGVDADRPIDRRAQTDLDLIDDEQLAGVAFAHLRQAFVELGRPGIADRDGAGQHGGAVGLGRVDPGEIVVRGLRDGGGDRLALDDHGLEVGAHAALGEPALTPELERQRIELAEMGRALDRCPAQPEVAGDRLVVDARMTVVGLLGQHLTRPTVRSAQHVAIANDLGLGKGSRHARQHAKVPHPRSPPFISGLT